MVDITKGTGTSCKVAPGIWIGGDSNDEKKGKKKRDALVQTDAQWLEAVSGTATATHEKVVTQTKEAKNPMVTDNAFCQTDSEWLKEVIDLTAARTAEQVQQSMNSGYLPKMKEMATEKEAAVIAADKMKKGFDEQQRQMQQQMEQADEDRKTAERQWLKENRKIWQDNRKLSEQVAEMAKYTMELEEELMAVATDSAHEEDMMAAKKKKRRKSRGQRKGELTRRSKNVRRRMAQKTYGRENKLGDDKQEMDEIRNECYFDGIRRSMADPEFQKSMSDFLSRMEEAMGLVPAISS